ncbi:amino acid ABC transporter permease [soil metagenome]
MVERGSPHAMAVLKSSPASLRMAGRVDWVAGCASLRTLLLLALGFAFSLAWAQGQAAPGRPEVWQLLIKWTPLVFSGFLFNLQVSLLSMAIGTVTGAMLGLGTMSPRRWVRTLCWPVVHFFRNAPWLVVLFGVMLLVPFQTQVFGVDLRFAPWMKAVVGLALPVMANVAEIVRGGIQTIPTAQWESADSLAFSRRQALWMIVLPQAVKRMIPPWMNQYALLTMNTTIISIVGIQEGLTMVQSALSAESRGDLLMPMYLMLLTMFFVYCYPIARSTLWLERRYAVKN